MALFFVRSPRNDGYKRFLQLPYAKLMVNILLSVQEDNNEVPSLPLLAVPAEQRLPQGMVIGIVE